MFRNSLVSSSSLVRKAALAVIIGLTFAFIGVAAVYASSPKTYSGTVGGVSWSAFDSIDIAPASGGTRYTGNSRTSANQPMAITVETTGGSIAVLFVSILLGIFLTRLGTPLVSRSALSQVLPKRDSVSGLWMMKAITCLPWSKTKDTTES